MAINKRKLAKTRKLYRRAFTNHLVLSEILKNLNSQDLLKFRRVSKLWCEVGSGIAFSRPDIKCRLYYERYRSKYCIGNPPIYQNRIKHDFTSTNRLKNLNLLIQSREVEEKKTWKFPCSVFSFQNGLFENSDLVDFFRLYGKNVRGLQITLHMLGGSDYEKLQANSILKDILLTQAPNLRTIQLVYYRLRKEPVQDPTTGKFPQFLLPENSILPNLETIEWSSNKSRILTEILLAAVNLRSFMGCCLENVKSVVETGKISTVRHLTLEICYVDSSNLEILALTPGLQLSSLVLNQLKPQDALFWSEIQGRELTPKYIRVAELVSKILGASKNTLKKIEMRQGTYLFNRRVFWPSFKKCNELKLEDCLDFPSTVEKATKCISYFLKAQVFPNLHKITFWNFSHFPKIGLDGDLNPDPNFLPFVTVRELRIESKRPTLYRAQEILRAFPDVELLVMEQIANFPVVAKYLWGFSKVKKLGLEIACGRNYPGSSFPALDAAFTGLGENVVRQIRKKRLTKKKIAEIVVEESILDLKELEHLQFRFVHQAHNKTTSYDFLTPNVTGKLAFIRMKKTKIEMVTRLITRVNVIEWIEEMQSALNPMSKFAQVTVEPYKKDLEGFFNSY